MVIMKRRSYSEMRVHRDISFGQPVPVPRHPHREELFPNIYSISTLFQFKAIPPGLITTCPHKKSLSRCSAEPLGKWTGCNDQAVFEIDIQGLCALGAILTPNISHP